MARTDPQFNVRMPSEIKQALMQVAEANRRSINSEIIAAIQFWIEANKKQNTPSIIRELSKSEQEAIDSAINILTKIRNKS
ncbi:TPA: Arc family DNA-binding protein [Yersinia enterocolitica]|nr:Arc family DNA-binding protein [Yersinia enterocolitica]HEB0976876.1 Arc family DNA-binding protein [Yersinia enterocolitica]